MRLWDEIAAIFDAYEEEEERKKREEEEELRRQEEEERRRQEEEELRRQEEEERRGEEEEEKERLLEEERARQEALEELEREEEEESLEFDGENLTWYADNQPVWQKKAMSGRNGYQCRKFQNIKNNGPIPEGDWMVKQDNLQNYDDLSLSDKSLNLIGGITGKFFNYPMGKWPGGKVAWGNNRVWLTPDENTNTYGRNNFSIHGGSTYGSSGCIDLTDDMDEFASRMRKYGRNIPLKVKYRKKCW